MSARRTLVELLVLAGGLVLLVAGVLFAARHAAGAVAKRVSPDVDRMLGEQVFRAVQSRSCTRPEPRQYVEAITAPLIDALGPTPFAFQFTVVGDGEVNAFALPGGFVTVNMGLLNAAETGEEVAAVLAHELQHVVQRHGTERLLRELGGGVMLSALFGGTDVVVPASMLSDFVGTAYDRDQEREADALGRELLVEAGIDPAGMARFFERLARQGPAVPELLSTHPDPGNRAAAAAEAARGANASRSLPPPRGLTCD